MIEENIALYEIEINDLEVYRVLSALFYLMSQKLINYVISITIWKDKNIIYHQRLVDASSSYK